MSDASKEISIRLLGISNLDEQITPV